MTLRTSREAMERASSEPPKEGGVASGNPFYSRKVQLACEVESLRPKGLPEHSPGSDFQPLSNDRAATGQCVGKGRGGQTSGRTTTCFLTPPSKPLGSDRETGVRRSEGRMPEEVEAKQTMGKLKTGDDAKFSDPESLQRALEIEVVSQLREQNARLMEELETYRQLKHTPKSGDGSSQSWVEIRDVQSGDGIDGQGCKTPRNTVNVGKCGEYTPNGTQVPTGTPPTSTDR